MKHVTKRLFDKTIGMFLEKWKKSIFGTLFYAISTFPKIEFLNKIKTKQQKLCILIYLSFY